MKRPKILGLAAASGKIGFAYLEGDQLADWDLSKAASAAPELAAAKARYWLSLHRPEVVVTERLDGQSRKRGKTIKLIEAFANEAKAAHVVHFEAVRRHSFKNKYEEARALAKRFPDMKPRLKEQPPCWKNEPTAMILFEALSLALSVNINECE